MNFKSLLLGLVLISVFATTGSALAMTDSERTTLITQLQAQIASLTQQLTQLLSQQQETGTTTTTTTTWCHTFNTSLGYSNSGTTEVSYLHIALQKQGISYTPDSINIYSQATATAVSQFQSKYGISQTGYVGTATRAKLNALYGCTTATKTTTNTVITNIVPEATITEPTTTTNNTTTATAACTENWSCASWDTCTNSRQTRNCVDVNNCGTTTNKPSISQSCDAAITNYSSSYNITAVTNNPTNITATSAKLNGTISGSFSSCTDCYYEFEIEKLIGSSFVNSNVLSSSKVSSSSGIAGFTTALDSSTTYRYRLQIWVTGGKYIAYGDYVTFTTSAPVATCSVKWSCSNWSACTNNQQSRTCTDLNSCAGAIAPSLTQWCQTTNYPVSVQTLSATNITSTRADLNGTAPTSYINSNYLYSFDFGKTGSYTTQYPAVCSSSGSCSATAGIAVPLSASTTYHYRLVAWQLGTPQVVGYGQDMSFTTPSGPAVCGSWGECSSSGLQTRTCSDSLSATTQQQICVASATTNAATNITANKVTLNGTVKGPVLQGTYPEGYSCVGCTFYYNFYLSALSTDGSAWVYMYTADKLYSSTGIIKEDVAVKPNQQYRYSVRVIEVNSSYPGGVEIAHGDNVTFTTPSN